MLPAMRDRDMSTVLKDWWTNLPTFSRIVLCSLGLTYLLSWISVGLVSLAISVPALNLFGFQVWRLFTSSFVCIQLITLLFTTFMFSMRTGKIERSMGTARYFVYFMLNTVCIQVMYTGLFTLLCMTEMPYFCMRYFSAGLWPMIMLEIVKQCCEDPERSMRLCCFPCDIKAKYFPLIFCAIFFIFAFPADIISGVILGYLRKVYADGYKFLECFKISDNCAQKLDSSCCSLFKAVPKFVASDQTESDDTNLFTFQVNQPNAQPASQPQSQPASQPQRFQPFSGQGYTLGGPAAAQGRNYQQVKVT